MASATSFVSTVQSLVAARDLQFLERVAQDYKLDLAELTAKFLEVPPAAAEEKKKKRAIKIRLTSDGKEIRCQGFTAKKEQCSFGPLPGQCFCKRHLPASAAPEAPEAPAQVPETPAEAPEAPEAPEEAEPFTVAEEDKVGFEDLSPLMALAPSKSLESSSHEGTPCNLWAKLEEVQAEADQEELDRELTRRQALEKEHEDMLAALRKQEEAESESEPEPAPYEPPANSPSPPKKAQKRRQSIRPKVAKK
jgi:hypothetical protein